MKIISDMLVTALYTVFVQNLVLSAGLGMSEAIRVSSKPGTFGRLAVMISGFSVATSIICSLLDTSKLLAVTGYAGRAAVYGGVLAAVYLVTAFIARFIFRAEPKFLGVLGVAALNTLLLAVPYINNSAAYSFADSIGSGIGAGIAFVLAAALIGKGAELLNSNDRIPQVFKGAPAMLLYVGLLSLAFAGFTDSTLFT